ncbi:hypothetical protein PLANPX_4618 [Lacipirellula parvula]|uniref:Uncharacterized protein n=2 Tax=Lacipirellula parvula TaxID=2650471 RepID=A0A5K7XKH0_9BACT|nr:hypothetical protein PLANPX_4618 [Lacipirellula parvula]
MGISGSNIVGYYIGDGIGQRGFVYNGSTFTTIEAPAPAAFTWASGIDGENIIGYYATPTSPTTSITRGFLLNGATFTTLECTLPGAVETLPTGIDGANIVGLYYDQAGYPHGFLYDGTTYVALDDPVGGGATLQGISGSQIVGSSYARAFVYDGSVFQELAPPQASLQRTVASGIDGSNIVGYYDTFGSNDNPPAFQRNGFIFDGSAYRTLNHPIAGPLGMTQPSDIDGNRVIGSYRGADGNFHGFITVVPEPAAMWLFSVAIPVMIRSARNRVAPPARQVAENRS